MILFVLILTSAFLWQHVYLPNWWKMFNISVDILTNKHSLRNTMKLHTTQMMWYRVQNMCVYNKKHGRIKSNIISYERRDDGLQLRTGVLWRAEFNTNCRRMVTRARINWNVHENVVYGMFVDTAFGNWQFSGSLNNIRKSECSVRRIGRSRLWMFEERKIAYADASASYRGVLAP